MCSPMNLAQMNSDKGNDNEKKPFRQRKHNRRPNYNYCKQKYNRRNRNELTCEGAKAYIEFVDSRLMTVI